MSWGIVFYVLLIVVGIITLVSDYSMKASGKIKIGWFIGQDVTVRDTSTIKDFIDHVFYRIQLFGGIMICVGCLLVVLELVGSGNAIVNLVKLVMLIGLIIYFFIFQRWLQKACKEILR